LYDWKILDHFITSCGGLFCYCPAPALAPRGHKPWLP
jgi:hypothetical protein